MTQAISTGTFCEAKWVVDPTAGQGTHTTIATALTSASSGDTIFIRPGTYTENLTLKAGVNLVAFKGDEATPNVSIVGKATMTTAGTVSISNIRLTTNSDSVLAVTGSAASIVNLENAYLNITSNVAAISHTSSSSSSVINVKNCYGDTGGATSTLFTSTSAGNIFVEYVYFTNTGSTSTASTTSTGQVTVIYSRLPFPLSATSTGTFVIKASYIECQNANVTALTTAGTGSYSVTNSFLVSGTASAISVGSGTTVQLYNSIIGSSNTNAITGLGTLNANDVIFNDTSSTINTTTFTSQYTELGKYQATNQPAFNARLNSTQSNVTGDGTAYTIIFDTESFDVGSNFNNSTGVFTAPVAGKYLFTVMVLVQNLGAAHAGTINLVTTGNTYTFGNWSAGVITGNMPNAFSTIALMAAGDTASVTANFSGGTKTVNIFGGGSYRTSFAGSKIN